MFTVNSEGGSQRENVSNFMRNKNPFGKHFIHLMFSSLLSQTHNNENCFLRTTLPNQFERSFLDSIVESLQFILSLTNSSSDECGRFVQCETFIRVFGPTSCLYRRAKVWGLRRGMKRANRVLWHNGHYDWKIFGAKKTQFSRRHKNFLAGGKDDDEVGPKSQHCRVVINSLLRQFNENFEMEEDLDSCRSRSRQNNDFE